MGYSTCLKEGSLKISLNNWKAIYWSRKNRLLNPRTYTEFEKIHRRLSEDELLHLQQARIISLVKLAYENTSFYKEKFDRIGLSYSDIRSVDDLHLIPKTTKDDVRKFFSGMMNNEARWHRRLSTTGGSTGIPLRLYHDRRDRALSYVWRMLYEVSLDPWCNKGLIYRDIKGLKSRLRPFFNLPERTTLLDASNFDEADIRSFIEGVVKTRAELVAGYSGGILAVAKFLKTNGLRIERVKAVWATSSMLTPRDREFISMAFNAPVIDQYGSCEIFSIAHSFNGYGSMLANSESRYLVLDGEGDTVKPRPILVTDLNNHCLPLINYEIGDQAVGLGFSKKYPGYQVINDFNGRIVDNLTLSNGAVVTGEFLTTLFDGYPEAVEAFQVYQNSEGVIRLKVTGVKNKRQLESVRSALAAKIGEPDVQVEPVEHIGLYRGKLRYVRSDFKPGKV